MQYSRHSDHFPTKKTTNGKTIRSFTPEVVENPMRKAKHSADQISSINAEMERLTSACKALTNENEILKRNNAQQVALLNRIRLENENVKDSFNTKIIKLEEKVLFLTQRNEITHNNFDDKIKEYENWKLKYHNIEQTALRVPGLVADNDRLIAEIIKIRANITDYDSVKNQNTKLNRQIKSVANERDNLHLAFTERGRSLQEMQDRVLHVEGLEGELALMTIEKEKLSQEKRGLARSLIEKGKEIEELRAKLKEFGIFGQRSPINDNDQQFINQMAMRRSVGNEGFKSKGASPGLHSERNIGDIEKDREALRRSILEKDNMIAELKGQIISYKQEIEDFNDLKMKLGLFTEENERLSAMLAQRSSELETLKLRFNPYTSIELELSQALEERNRISQILMDKLKEIEALKIIVSEFELERKNVIELKEKVVLILEENQRLISLINEKDEQISMLKQKNLFVEDSASNITIQITEKDSQISMLRTKLMELDSQSVLLQDMEDKLKFADSERERAIAFLQEKTSELDDMRIKMNLIQDENATIGGLKLRLTYADQDISQLKTSLTEKDLEIYELKIKAELLNQAEQKIAILLDEQERLCQENSQLKTTIAEKVIGLENMTIQIENAGVNNEKDSQALREQVKELERVALQLRTENESFKGAVALGKEELGYSQVKVNELEAENGHYRQEIERLEKLIAEKETIKTEKGTEEDHRLKEMISENENLKKNQADFEETILTAQREIIHLKQEMLEKERLIMLTESTKEHERLLVEDLKTRLAFLSFENERLGTLIADQFSQIESLRNQNVQNSGVEEFVLEREKFVKALTEKHVETETLKARVVDLEKESVMLADLKQKMAQLYAHSEKMKYVLGEKVKEVEGFKAKILQYGQLETKLKESTQERDKLCRIIVEKIQENDFSKATIASLEAKNTSESELKIKINVLTAEKEGLNELLNEKVKSIEEWQEKYTKLEKLFISGVQGSPLQLDTTTKHSHPDTFSGMENVKSPLRKTLSHGSNFQVAHGLNIELDSGINSANIDKMPMSK